MNEEFKNQNENINDEVNTNQLEDTELPLMNEVQPHNYNVMPDGMLYAISPTDLALLAIVKDAPRTPDGELITEENSVSDEGRNDFPENI